MKNWKIGLGLCISILLISSSLLAQEDYSYPSLSPKGKLYQVVGNTILKLEYERPIARKRKVFGGLVPWNKVWRTGAGHCTKISFSKSVRIGGQEVEAGTYALLSIPKPDEWILILNRDTTLYGGYAYNAEKDLARFVVIPQQSSRHYESLNFDIELLPNNARIYLSWENTQVHFEVETSTDAEMEKFIQEKLLTGIHKNSDIYAGAAEYYLYQGSNFHRAIQLADKALEIDTKNGWARNLKISLYERLDLHNKALEEIEKAIQHVKTTEFEQEKHRLEEIERLQLRAAKIKKQIKQ